MNYGRYQIIEELGRGSMGVVYKAHDPQIDRTIALKVLREDRVTSDDFVRRFLKEAMAVGRLSHPGIVTVYDIGQDHGSIFIAMEFLDGTPLDEMMSSRKFTVREIVDIGIQTAQALHYAHQHGIIHRDIKPPNLIYSTDGSIRITDFGIARIEDPNGHQMTQAGEILGTPLYMSPEQVMGLSLDGRSDVYSLGVILYQLATGKRPFQGPTLAATFRAITQDTPETPQILDPAIPEALSAVIMRLLEKEPSRRFAGGDDLIAALRNCLPTPPPKPQPAAPPPLPEKPKSSSGLTILIVGIVCVVGLAVGGYFMYKQKTAVPPSTTTTGTTPSTGTTTAQQPEQTGSPQSSGTTTAQQPGQTVAPPSSGVDAQQTASIGAAVTGMNQLLREGTALSIIVTDLPKKEAVLKSAQELGKISPRYQEDVKMAENTYNNAKESRDKKLTAYIDELTTLSHADTGDQLTAAMNQIRKETLSERQKNTASLIEEHLKSLRNGDRLDKEKIIDDFSRRFNDFTD